jgi:hypothetical protein
VASAMSCAPSCWRRRPAEEPSEVRVYTRGSRDREPEGDDMVLTVPHYALEQARDAAHGGDCWLSREGTTAAAGVLWHDLVNPRDASRSRGG